MTDAERKRREEIRQIVYAKHRAKRAAELRDPAYWRGLAVCLAACTLRRMWATASVSAVLTLWLLFLSELSLLGNAPLVAFRTAFNELFQTCLILVIAVQAMVLPFIPCRFDKRTP